MDDHDPFSDLSAGTSLEDEESLEGVCLSFRPIYKAAPDGAAVECIEIYWIHSFWRLSVSLFWIMPII